MQSTWSSCRQTKKNIAMWRQQPCISPAGSPASHPTHTNTPAPNNLNTTQQTHRWLLLLLLQHHRPPAAARPSLLHRHCCHLQPAAPAALQHHHHHSPPHCCCSPPHSLKMLTHPPPLSLMKHHLLLGVWCEMCVMCVCGAQAKSRAVKPNGEIGDSCCGLGEGAPFSQTLVLPPSLPSYHQPLTPLHHCHSRLPPTPLTFPSLFFSLPSSHPPLTPLSHS